MALQYGVPLEVLVSKFSHVRFEPSGFTKNPEIPIAKSLIDYIFRFLGTRFLSAEQRAAVGLVERTTPSGTPSATAAAGRAQRRDARRHAAAQPSDRLRDRPGVDAGADHVQPAGRCAELPGLRLDHGAQRHLLQVPQLRRDQRLLVSAEKRRGDTTDVCGEDGEVGFGGGTGGLPGGGGVRGCGRGAPFGAPRGGDRRGLTRGLDTAVARSISTPTSAP